MLKNRSVPADILLPPIVDQHVEEAIAWLSTAFGFAEHDDRDGGPGEPASGAPMHLGDAWIMLRRARPGSSSPSQLGRGTERVDPVEAHDHRAKAAGAKIVEEPQETE